MSQILHFYINITRIIFEGFIYLISFGAGAFQTSLLSIMPVCACHNLLSVNLNGYNYKVGNDIIILKRLRENIVIQL